MSVRDEAAKGSKGFFLVACVAATFLLNGCGAAPGAGQAARPPAPGGGVLGTPEAPTGPDGAGERRPAEDGESPDPAQAAGERTPTTADKAWADANGDLNAYSGFFRGQCETRAETENVYWDEEMGCTEGPAQAAGEPSPATANNVWANANGDLNAYSGFFRGQCETRAEKEDVYWDEEMGCTERGWGNVESQGDDGLSVRCPTCS